MLASEHNRILQVKNQRHFLLQLHLALIGQVANQQLILLVLALISFETLSETSLFHLGHLINYLSYQCNFTYPTGFGSESYYL
jgi:hypothetical protein